MLVAIIIVLWISALASAFIDNIPFTTATIPVIVELANSEKLCLALRPLVWALAFGACLGGKRKAINQLVILKNIMNVVWSPRQWHTYRSIGQCCGSWDSRTERL